MSETRPEGATRQVITPVPELGRLARSGDLDGLADALERHPRPDVVSACGWSALADAAWAGHSEAVRLLLNSELDVNAPTLDGITPLMIAAARGHLSVVRLLCAQGARLDRRSKDGRTAVESALQAGEVQVALLLHQQGAVFDGPLATLYVRALCARQGIQCALVDPAEQMARGAAVWRWVLSRPLQMEPENWAPLDGLLDPTSTTQAGTSMAVRTLRFRTPVEFVVDSKHAALVDRSALPSRGWRYRCGWTEHVQALLHGEDTPDVVDQFGYIPLLEAIRNNAPAAVHALLAAGADVARLPHYGCMRGATMLINAADQGNPEVVQALIEAGAAVDIETPSGWTALMLAASRGHADTVRLLVNAGAELRVRNAQGQTALALAQKRRHPEVARLLLVANNGLQLVRKSERRLDELE